MKNNKSLKRLILLAAFLFIIFFLIKGWWSFQIGPVSKDKNTKLFVIRKGESVSDIANRLEKEKLIHSSLIFKIVLKLQRDNPHVEAGDFNISPSQSMDEIITTLSKGSLDKWVTIIEGWRDEEIAEKLSSQLGIEKQEFLNYAKEGYMFPDTYLFNKNVAVQDIVSTLKNTFKQKYNDSLQSKIKSNGLTIDEGVILASIVEREARSDEARKMVASILLKRLKIGMGLNADSTVQYALGYQRAEKSWWKRNLTLDDLKINSPFNTYIHSGLPSAAICNPGLSSLTAVANADLSTPFLYYYHDSKGISHYAKTLDEHNENVAKYP